MYDVFISHASEDKASFVAPLAHLLQERGLSVWYDELALKLGDSLLHSIDHGLASSRYGIVVLSTHFFAKDWPQRELDGLMAREINGVKVILPIWHEITRDEVTKRSPILVGRLAARSVDGMDSVVSQILDVVRPDLNPFSTPPMLSVSSIRETVDPTSPADQVRMAVEISLPTRNSLIRRYMKSLAGEIMSLNPDYGDEQDTWDTKLLEAIAKTQNQVFDFARIAEVIAEMDDIQAAETLYKGFTEIANLYTKPISRGIVSYTDLDFELPKFVGHELFTTFFSFLLRERRWDLILFHDEEGVMALTPSRHQG